MLVYDVDHSPDDLDDLVEAILISISSDVASDFNEPTMFNGVFGYGKMRVRFKVDCEDDFYGQGMKSQYQYYST